MNHHAAPGATRAPGKEHEPHRGQFAVQVGNFEIFPAGDMVLRPENLDGFGVVVSLTESVKPVVAASTVPKKIHYPIEDFQGPPAYWMTFLGDLRDELEAGQKILIHCAGGHGRTGTILAGLIALLEPEIDDPIAAVRERYCYKAVEMLVQAEAIFALWDEDVPEHWKHAF